MAIKSVRTIRLTYKEGKTGPKSITGVSENDCDVLNARYLDISLGPGNISPDVMVTSYRVIGRGREKSATNGKSVLIHMNDVEKINADKPTPVIN